MRFTKTFVFLFTVAGAIGQGASAQNLPGKLSLSKGQKIQIDNNIKTVSNQEMGGQPIEITLDLNTSQNLEVKDKKKSSYVLSSTLTKLLMNGNVMGQALKFDSDKKEDLESETGKALSSQLNVGKEIELDEKAALVNAPAKDTSSAEASGQMESMIKSMMGNGDQSNAAVLAFNIVPAGKKVGDSWSDSTITDDIKIYRNYTLKNLSGNEATVAVAGKQVTRKKMEQQGMEINVNIEGTISGEATVDVNTGLVKQQTTLMDGVSNTEVMGQTITGTTKVTTTTTTKKI